MQQILVKFGQTTLQQNMIFSITTYIQITTSIMDLHTIGMYLVQMIITTMVITITVITIGMNGFQHLLVS